MGCHKCGNPLILVDPKTMIRDCRECGYTCHTDTELRRLSETEDALRAKVAELDQQAARDKARIDRLEALLQEAMKREYNSFEPDNQSAHYKRLQAALNRKEADRA